ncbi:MAG: ABC transporter permease [Defluviitaleaceae bacterium]|nr:ABC transporter permease [Defluviitaleaceae bacterium]
MNVFESITSAIYSVFANRMRSILTMLGIIIGIAAVIMITSLGQGFQNSVNELFAGIGAGAMQVSMSGQNSASITQRDLLTVESANFLMSHPSVDSVSPISSQNARVVLRNPQESTRVSVLGTTQSFREIQEVDVRAGRFLADIDVVNAAPVAVIDARLARDVFGRADVVGERIRVINDRGAIELTVIGVFRDIDMMAGMFQMPTTIYIPITLLQGSNFRGNNFVDAIFVNSRELERLDQTGYELARMLSIMHGNEDRYNVQSMMSQVDMVNDILGMITGFVGLVAAISLIVGGIGVMNIMLVTVTERTREIGIRKSLGATDGNIQFQFLVEAIILTATGGLIGIVLGYYGGFALGGIIDMTPAVDVAIVIGTVIVSSLIGIIFGVYPARKAALLDPIEALRYE